MNSDIISLQEILQKNNFRTVSIQKLESRDPRFFPVHCLNLHHSTKELFSQLYPSGFFSHQIHTLEEFLKGKNVCVSTSTASGKSLIFYTATIDHLNKNPLAKIIALYPMKSLGYEQEKRWKDFLNKSGLSAKVGRIDGNVSVRQRMDILKNSTVLIMTPDIIHAWLFTNLSERSVIQFLQCVEMVIVDEVHTYTGVFGSNAAFLFRRLNHFLDILGKKPQYITASATIKNPDVLLDKLFGLPFHVLGPEYDTSPKQEIDIHLLTPPTTKDLLSSITGLMRDISKFTDRKFIAFVDSRKQTENIATILTRDNDSWDEEDIEVEKEGGKDQTSTTNFNQNEYLISKDLRSHDILPYRSGYEEEDRRIIQDRLTSSSVSGIISTSALELGIDIPHLTLAILIGVPNSSTSFYQRIGRIGRTQPGTVFVINNDSIASQTVFRNPDTLLKLPLNESALYLENERIQYIHTLCLCRDDGEHYQIQRYSNTISEESFRSNINWPPGFLELCEKEESGSIPQNLQGMKSNAGDKPNFAFPLRDVDMQYKVVLREAMTEENKGSLSFAQVMREAYPGAVYYYATKPLRVCNVKQIEHKIEVRSERHYFTKPIILPPQIYPNLDNSRIKQSHRYDDLILIECDLAVRETLTGFTEKKGMREIRYEYPINGDNGIYFREGKFTHTIFTTGVILLHPIFDTTRVHTNILSQIFYEAFLLTIPYERNDLNCGDGKIKRAKNFIQQGQKFICLYDQTYGSLRLSARIMEKEILEQVFEIMTDLAENEFNNEGDEKTSEAILYLDGSLDSPCEQSIFSEDDIVVSDDKLKIIAPGSLAIHQVTGKEFYVERFFCHPKHNLVYQGKYTTWEKGVHGQILVPFKELTELPGESWFAFYSIDTAEIIKADIETN